VGVAVSDSVQAARLHRAIGIDGVATGIHVQHLALLADHERGALGERDQRRLDPVAPGQLALVIGDEPERGANLAPEGRLRGLLVRRDGQDLRFMGTELVVPVPVRF
jgi:hypothetical protein